MQASELFRRAIVVPKDDEGEADLRSWNVSENISVDVLSIESASTFNLIWNSGLFQRINEVCGTLIDDYEEEMLELESLECAITVARKHVESFSSGVLRDFGERFLAILNQAKVTRRPVFLIL
jgi:hypothetical protein